MCAKEGQVLCTGGGMYVYRHIYTSRANFMGEHRCVATRKKFKGGTIIGMKRAWVSKTVVSYLPTSIYLYRRCSFFLEFSTVLGGGEEEGRLEVGRRVCFLCVVRAEERPPQ